MKTVLYSVLGLTLTIGTAWAQSAGGPSVNAQPRTGTQMSQQPAMGQPNSGQAQSQSSGATSSSQQRPQAGSAAQQPTAGPQSVQAQGRSPAGGTEMRTQSSQNNAQTGAMQREDRAALESLPPSIRQQVMDRYGPEQQVDELVETMILNRLAAQHAVVRNLRRDGNMYRADVMQDGQWTVITVDPQSLGG
jgi:hypothetical protein